MEFSNLHLVTPTEDGFDVKKCHVHIDSGVVRIEEIPRFESDAPNSCDGAIALPGLVNAHTHIYSALAAGLDPGRSLDTFTEVLEGLWWRLDKSHNSSSMDLSARVSARECFEWGVTGVFDHHVPAPGDEMSLVKLSNALSSLSLKHSLCLENSGRHSDALFERIIDETFDNAGLRDKPMIGLHASFTLDDKHLERIAAADPDMPVHIHVAEAEADVIDCRRRFNETIIERLDRFGLLRPRSIVAHGCWLEDKELETLAERGVYLALAPLSNLNNAQPPLDITRAHDIGVRIVPSTDGLGGDVLGSWRQAFAQQRAAHPGGGFPAAGAMLRNMYALKQQLGPCMGVEEGEQADLAIMDYLPAGPVNADTLLGHLLYGVAGRRARWVVRGGAIQVYNGTYCEPYPDYYERVAITRALWERFKHQE